MHQVNETEDGQNTRDVLHWLPLRQRIEFRVAVVVWYSLIGQAHAYLTELTA